MSGSSIIQADIVEWTKNYTGPLFHAVLCDPPYNLDSIKKRFGTPNSVPAKSGPFKRIGRGFMGKEWDTDIAFEPETWQNIGNLLHFGAFCMAFSSTRTYHRMATAIEDAGFVVHPMIGWVNGSGFPKATKIKDNEIFEGHRYGLQALKPSFEPICVFQKPYEGRPLDCIASTGAGTLNIDGGRFGDETVVINKLEEWSGLGQIQRPEYESVYGKGRWPANIVISGDVDLWYDKFFYCAKANRKERDAGLDSLPDTMFGQSGGAQGRLAEGEEEYLQDSIDLNRIKRVKNPHPTVKPLDLCRWLAALLLPPEEYDGRLLVPFSGSGSEVIGALQAGWNSVTGVEIEEESCNIANLRIKHWIKETDDA